MNQFINKKRTIQTLTTVLILGILLFGISLFASSKKGEKIDIHIGYQSITAQTWGALIIKNQELFENKLQERYPDVAFNVQWHDEVSGSVINNNMLAHKYQIGYMGDMPCIINLYNSYSQKGYQSRMLAIDGRGENGRNQSILVSQDSGINQLEDLAGHTISVPIGSSTHRMLLEILAQNNLLDDIEVVHQDIPTAYNMILAGKISALAAWEPYPSLLVDERMMIKLVDGEKSQNNYLTGIMIDSEWEREHQELVQIYLECIVESHVFLTENKAQSIRIISKESGFSAEVVKTVLNNIEWRAEITDDDLVTFQESYEFMIGLNILDEFPIAEYIKVNGKEIKLIN